MSNPSSTLHDFRQDLLGKVCSICKKYQFFDEFTRRRKDSDDRQGTCKSCVRAQQRANPSKYARNLEWIQNKWRSDPEWKRARMAAVSDYRHWRRARGSLPRGGVDRFVVFERDGYVCQLCEIPIDRNAEPKSPLSASVDHITPLSRGGEHSYENVQTAHLFCNISKGARDAPKAMPPKVRELETA